VNEVTTELYKNVSPPHADQQTGEDKQTGGEQKSESTSDQGTTKENSSN